MRNLSKLFEKKKIEYEKLKQYGFVKKNNGYLFEKQMKDPNFKVVVEISKEKQTSKVIDLETQEEFFMVDISGSYGQKIREEYETLLEDIAKTCTSIDVFKGKQTKEIIKYVKETYGDDLEFLWKKFSENAIWRNQTNKKWYGALLVIPENKLGFPSDQKIEILDLRYPKEKIKDFIDEKRFFRGYHMNKDHWITIKLDNQVKTEEIFSLIDLSYQLSLKK